MFSRCCKESRTDNLFCFELCTNSVSVGYGNGNYEQESWNQLVVAPKAKKLISSQKEFHHET